MLYLFTLVCIVEVLTHIKCDLDFFKVTYKLTEI